MSSVTCTPQVRQKRKVTQPAFTRVHAHNFLHSCAITYMRQTHNAHNILTLATVTFKTFSTLYAIHIIMSFKTRLDQLNVPAPRSTSQLIIAPLSNQSILQSTLFTTHTHTYSTQIHTHANSVTLQLTSTYTPIALPFESHLYLLK